MRRNDQQIISPFSISTLWYWQAQSLVYPARSIDSRSLTRKFAKMNVFAKSTAVWKKTVDSHYAFTKSIDLHSTASRCKWADFLFRPWCSAIVVRTPPAQTPKGYGVKEFPFSLAFCFQDVILHVSYLFDRLDISILPRNKTRRFYLDIEMVELLTPVICKWGAGPALGSLPQWFSLWLKFKVKCTN